MALTVSALTELDPAVVAQMQAQMSALMQEQYPNVFLSRGVIYDLLVYFAGGISGAVNRTEINRILQANSLLAISQNPQLADPALAAAVFSNYMVTPNPAVAATGNITLIVGAATTVVVAAGTSFTANGVLFEVSTVITARPPGVTLQLPTDVSLQPLDNGNYAFTVPATAATSGVAGNIGQGTQLVPSVPGQFITAYAAGDFSGGADAEPTAATLQRLQQGIAAHTWSNRTNIAAVLNAQLPVGASATYSIIGIGNPEMTRDQHWIWPMSGGGRTDVYARTSPLPVSVTLTKTATLVAITATGSLWQFAMGKNDAPGFYEVTQIIRPGDDPSTAGFSVTQDIRGYDLSGGGFVPDVVNAVEAAYTRYQTATIQFLDTATVTTNMTVNSTTATYNVTVSAMPYIGMLQDFANSIAARNIAGDVLIKAPVPCFLTINFTVQQANTEVAPNLSALNNALAAVVNSLTFPGQLLASTVTGAMQQLLTQRQAIGQLDMHGRIRYPNGQTTYVRNRTELVLPADPLNFVTGNTTIFLLSPANVGSAVVTEGFASTT